MNLDGSYTAEITRSVFGEPYTENGIGHFSNISLCNGTKAKTLSGIVGFESIGGVYIPNESQGIDRMKFFADMSGSVAFYNAVASSDFNYSGKTSQATLTLNLRERPNLLN